MTTVALLGSTGFVGSRVRAALSARGAEVRMITAPRLNTSARDLSALAHELRAPSRLAEIQRLSSALSGCDAVLNAAGIATATGDGDALFGANALLPGVVAQATPPGARLVHVSSAAVQGRQRVLDETRAASPFSPYSTSKALGESLALSEHTETICFRPTSVHGPGRAVSVALVRVLRSPMASVAGSGRAPTPQVLVENVADAAAFLALVVEQPPAVVLQPWEGMTTGDLVRVLGHREPHRIPSRVAKLAVGVAHLAGRRSGAIAGLARRLEMLWFGQGQSSGWLDGRWSTPNGRDKWEELA